MDKSVIIVVEKMVVGGVQRLIVDDTREMSRRDIRVFLVTLRPEDEMNSLMDECAVPVGDRVCINMNSLRDVRGYFRLWKFFRRVRPGIVMTHMWFGNTVGRVAAFFARVPKVLAFEHSIYDGIKSQRLLRIDRVLQYACDKVVAVSPMVKESLVRNGVQEKNIVVLPNAIDQARYRTNAQNGTVRKEFGIDPSEFVFATVGRLGEMKNIDLLISAFEKFSRGVLFVVGDGKERASLERLSRNLRVSGRVYFMGRRADIADILADVDCFVLSSLREGFGIVALEAMAAGVPAVISDKAGVVEFLEDGEDALIFPSGDKDALVKRMKMIMEDGVLRVRVRAGALKRLDDFSIKKHVDRLLAI
ncbi:hypothetical protein AUJ44_00345 [Candidatus Nomurabacteria bacterium CG1_02_47_685]|nr:MAG: hypothetical protein AUJ44_00345 [Candidatus Nomurabacteria bacterium CG1_02_47_685]